MEKINFAVEEALSKPYVGMVGKWVVARFESLEEAEEMCQHTTGDLKIYRNEKLVAKISNGKMERLPEQVLLINHLFASFF